MSVFENFEPVLFPFFFQLTSEYQQHTVHFIAVSVSLHFQVQSNLPLLYGIALKVTDSGHGFCSGLSAETQKPPALLIHINSDHVRDCFPVLIHKVYDLCASLHLNPAYQTFGDFFILTDRLIVHQIISAIIPIFHCLKENPRTLVSAIFQSVHQKADIHLKSPMILVDLHLRKIDFLIFHSCKKYSDLFKFLCVSFQQSHMKKTFFFRADICSHFPLCRNIIIFTELCILVISSYFTQTIFL